MTRLENEVHEALAVMDKETGKMLNYRQLIRHAKYIKKCGPSHQQMNLADCEGEVPTNRKKDVTPYGQFVCTIRPEMGG